MTEHDKVFFDILRSALWGTPVQVPHKVDWIAVMKLAKTQALMGLVANVLLTNGEIRSSLPAELVSKLRSVPMANIATHTQMNMTLQLLVLTLREVGIEPVLLKGQGLAKNYPVPEMRQCGDIDLYVGVENFRKSYDELKKIVSEIDAPTSIVPEQKHYHARLGCIMIEVHQYADIHSSSTYNRIYQEYAKAGLSDELVSVQFGDICVSTPSDDFNAFYVFNHLWHHFMTGGIGLRQVCDWTLFLHSRAGRLDLVYLSTLLDRMKLMLPWQTFGCIAVDVLGLPEEEFPFYLPKHRKKARVVLERIMQEGNFGQQTEFMRKPTRGYLYEKMFSLKCYIKRFFGLLILFPYHAFQQISFSVVEGIERLYQDLRNK